MKKIIILILAATMLATMVFALSGCANKSVEESRLLLEEYYDLFSDYDAEEIVELFGEDIIDDLGGEDDAIILMLSRIATLGEDVEYEIVGTSYEKNNKNIQVQLNVEATYDRDDKTYEEMFLFENIDDEMIITGIDLEREDILDSIPKAFFNAYNQEDEEEMLSLFADAYFDEYSEEELYDMLTQIQNALGQYQSHEVYDEYYYYDEYEDEGIVFLYEGYFDVEFEKGSSVFELELCLEDDEIKINFFSVDPKSVIDLVDEYYSNMENLDYDSVLNMYSDTFFDNTDGGVQGWTEVLEAVSSYGDHVGYLIVDWAYEEIIQDDDTLISFYNVYVKAQFGDTIFKNDIYFADEDIQYITYHSVEIEE